MNDTPANPLIDCAIHGLQNLGLGVVRQKTPRGTGAVRVDAWLRVGKGKATTDYLVAIKRSLTPAMVGATLAQLRDLAAGAKRPALLVAEYVTAPVAETLRAQRQQFADATGNAYLEGPGLLVYVTGRRPSADRVRARTARTFTVNGLKVLFALLCDPGLAAAPYRAIAAAAGVALGALPAVLADLQEAGQLLVADKTRRLDGTKRLLDEWAFAYARLLRPKTMAGAYTTPAFETWKDWRLDPAEARWGGEPAANLLVRHLRPAILTIYAEKLPARLVVEKRLVPVGRMALPPYVEVRKPFWGKTLRIDVDANTVPPVLVYADLLATGDGRCIGTAQIIYDAHLARLLPAA